MEEGEGGLEYISVSRREEGREGEKERREGEKERREGEKERREGGREVGR